MRLLTYVAPLIVIAISIPMAFGKVGPNGFYGFRTPKTLSSPEIWYPANRVSGWLLIAAGACTIVVNLVLLALFPELPRRTLLLWMTFSNVVPILCSFVVSLLYIRRL